ncbi:MAG: PQQ-binding-like beta-propeller repeat protein [Armatimonadetes bacterium]|nr:PQQ-binding-like beta-propeller repeat protein [Armatimonadota bacterium]
MYQGPKAPVRTAGPAALSSEPRDEVARGRSSEELKQAMIEQLFRSDLTEIELWRQRIPEGAQAPPAVGPQGQLAIVHKSGVTLLDANGTIRKSFGREYLEVNARPVFDEDGKLYVSGYLKPGLTAYSPDGEKLWELQEPYHYTSRVSPVLRGDRIYFAEGTGQLKVFDRTGKFQGSSDTQDSHRVGAQLYGLRVAEDGTAFTVGHEGQLSAVRNDHMLWARSGREGARLGSNVTFLGNGDLLYCDRQGHLQRVTSSGQPVWRFSWWDKKLFSQLGEEERTRAEGLNLHYGFGSTPVLSPDGKRVYVGRRDLFGSPEPSLTALTTEGEHLWTVPLQLGDSVGPENVQVDSKGFLYVGGEYGNTVQCLSPEGQILWTFRSASRTGRLSLGLHRDVLYLSTESGWVHALSRDAVQRRIAEMKDEGAPPTIWVEEDRVHVGGVTLPRRKS